MSSFYLQNLNLYTVKFTLFFGIQFYDFWQMHGVVFCNFDSDQNMGKFHPSEYSPVLPLCNPSLAPSLKPGIYHLLSLSIVLLSPLCHTNGIMKHITFWTWLLSLIMHLKYIHIVGCINDLFLLIAE